MVWAETRSWSGPKPSRRRILCPPNGSTSPMPRASGSRRCSTPPGGAGARHRAVRALLHLRQGRPCGRTRIADGLTAARHRGAALRLHRARRERRRVRQHDVLLQRRRPGRGRRPLARTHARARDPDRPQPRRRRRARRRRRVPEARAVVTIAAPSDPAHVTGLFKDDVEEIASGRARSRSRSAAGRSASAATSSTTSPSRTLKSASRTCARRCWSSIRRPTIRSASRTRVTSSWRRSIPRASSRSPAPIICSAGASDAVYVANVIAAWAERYLDIAADASRIGDGETGDVVVSETRRGRFEQEVIVGRHRLLADEPEAVGRARQRAGPLRSSARRRLAPARR